MGPCHPAATHTPPRQIGRKPRRPQSMPRRLPTQLRLRLAHPGIRRPHHAPPRPPICAVSISPAGRIREDHDCACRDERATTSHSTHPAPTQCTQHPPHCLHIRDPHDREPRQHLLITRNHPHGPIPAPHHPSHAHLRNPRDTPAASLRRPSSHSDQLTTTSTSGNPPSNRKSPPPIHQFVTHQHTSSPSIHTPSLSCPVLACHLHF
jgi:hypothetical protein